MMHNNIMFDREAAHNAMQRKNRMKRMEELSHSLDDGLNNLPDDYGNSRQPQMSHSRGRQQQQQQQHYDDIDDEDDYGDDEYIDDYYNYNSNRPRSYNEKYSSYSMYDDYDSNNSFARNRYSLNDQNKRYTQQQQQQQQKYSSLRKQQSGSSAQSNSNPSNQNTKHINFNDEDDVRYMSDKKKPPSSPTKKPSKELPQFSPSKKDILTKKKMENEKQSSLQVMKAKLKIHNLSNDDSVLQTSSNRSANKQIYRHHSVEAKLPSHHTDRSNMSPTIMEEIEFETQDEFNETETEKEQEMEETSAANSSAKDSKDKKSKSDKKDKEKDKKGNNNSAPSTPTTKKSLKAHLSNHKKLFKVPDIDLNKFSCFFSSSKNIAALKGKKDDDTSKSAEALNATASNIAEPSSSKSSSPKSSPVTKSPPIMQSSLANKTPPLSPKKIAMEEKNIISGSKINSNRVMGSGSTIQSSIEQFPNEDSISDVEFEVTC
jgi:hypothetical protein